MPLKFTTYFLIGIGFATNKAQEGQFDYVGNSILDQLDIWDSREIDDLPESTIKPASDIASVLTNDLNYHFKNEDSPKIIFHDLPTCAHLGEDELKKIIREEEDKKRHLLKSFLRVKLAKGVHQNDYMKMFKNLSEAERRVDLFGICLKKAEGWLRFYQAEPNWADFFAYIQTFKETLSETCFGYIFGLEKGDYAQKRQYAKHVSNMFDELEILKFALRDLERSVRETVKCWYIASVQKETKMREN